jgi:hypothetical protein
MAGRVHRRGRFKARAVWVIPLVIGLAPWSEGIAQQGSGGEGGGASLKGAVAPCPAEGGLPSFKSFSQIEIDPRLDETELPQDCSESLFSATKPASKEALGRGGWGGSAASWVPTGLVHRPLYFDQHPLERHGQTCGKLQPVVSWGHFLADLTFLPLRMAADHPCRCVAAAYPGRPGSPPPCQRERWFWGGFDSMWCRPPCLPECPR